jgi:hypothetical protein
MGQVTSSRVINAILVTLDFVSNIFFPKEFKCSTKLIKQITLGQESFLTNSSWQNKTKTLNITKYWGYQQMQKSSQHLAIDVAEI